MKPEETNSFEIGLDYRMFKTVLVLILLTTVLKRPIRFLVSVRLLHPALPTRLLTLERCRVMV